MSVKSLALIGNVAATGCRDEAMVLAAGTFSIRRLEGRRCRLRQARAMEIECFFGVGRAKEE
jgi:hypothetical protein